MLYNNYEFMPLPWQYLPTHAKLHYIKYGLTNKWAIYLVNNTSVPHISPTLCYLWCALLVIFRRSISAKTPNNIVSKLGYGQPYSVHLNTYSNHMDESAIWEINCTAQENRTGRSRVLWTVVSEIFPKLHSHPCDFLLPWVTSTKSKRSLLKLTPCNFQI